MNKNSLQHTKNLIITVTAVLACTGFCNSAFAQDDGDWDFRITPYIWFMQIDGETAVAGQNIPVDASFSDILDNLNLSLAANFEANNGKFFFVLDGLYADLEADIEPNPIISATAEVQIVMAYANVGVSISEYFDLYTGVVYQDQDIKIIPGMLPSVDLGDDWTDYVIGVRAQGSVSENWFFRGRWETQFAGDSESLFSFDVIFSRYFGSNKNMHLDLGFRYFSTDYESGSGLTRFLWDVDMFAPVIGYSWTF